MCLLPNGDCLEFGHMVNPATGQDEPYKEYWHSADPLPVPAGVDDAKLCFVAQVASPANVEGVVIRIGGRIQGIISRRQSDDAELIEVERWTCEGVNAKQPSRESIASMLQDGWSKDPRSTGSFVPLSWLTSPIRGIGDNLEYAGLLWNITEVQQ